VGYWTLATLQDNLINEGGAALWERACLLKNTADPIVANPNPPVRGRFQPG
jgi:hypothetical protein